MSTQTEFLSRELLCHNACILQRFLLRGNLRHTGHLKVFLPARQRVIRSAERQIQRSVSCVNRQRRELLALADIQPIHETVQFHISETLGGCHFLQHLRNLIRNQNAHIDMGIRRKFRKIKLCSLSQRHPHSNTGSRKDFIKIDEGELCQN